MPGVLQFGPCGKFRAPVLDLLTGNGHWEKVVWFMLVWFILVCIIWGKIKTQLGSCWERILIWPLLSFQAVFFFLNLNPIPWPILLHGGTFCWLFVVTLSSSIGYNLSTKEVLFIMWDELNYTELWRKRWYVYIYQKHPPWLPRIQWLLRIHPMTTLNI